LPVFGAVNWQKAAYKTSSFPILTKSERGVFAPDNTGRIHINHKNCKAVILATTKAGK
jgi:hypothetical protein